MHSPLSITTITAILLHCSSVLGITHEEASALHGGHGGGIGGHGGGFGGHHGGFGFHHHGGYGGGFGMYPGFLAPPPPMALGLVPPPPPLPIAVAPPVPLGVPAPPVQVGIGGAPIMQGGLGSSALFSTGVVGAAPVINTGFAASPSYQFVADQGAGLGSVPFANNGVSAQANAQVSLNGLQQPSSFVVPQQSLGLVAQAAPVNMASLGRYATVGAQSGRMLDQSTDGLQIAVDGSAAGSQQMPPPPPLAPQPAPAMPSPPPAMPPQPLVTTGSTLVSKGFVRKSESYQEQKSGSRNSNKEFEKVTTQA